MESLTGLTEKSTEVIGKMVNNPGQEGFQDLMELKEKVNGSMDRELDGLMIKRREITNISCYIQI